MNHLPSNRHDNRSLSGTAIGRRPTSIVYPNSRQLNFVYNSGLDSTISRISSLADAAGTGAGNIESYSYLGPDTIVRRVRPGSALTYVKGSGEANGAAGDQYNGLDEFGRVIDQRWVSGDTVGSGGSGDTLAAATDRFQLGYDADSNLLYKNNLMSSSNSELYHGNGSSNPYDNLNRLVEFQRGTLSSDQSSIQGTASRDQVFSLDTLGNWGQSTNSSTPATAVTTNGTAQSRAHNARNEYTSVGGVTPTYDNNGNLTKDENGQQYVYDAWNRLVAVKNSAGVTIATYSYDPFGRRITETENGTTTDLYLDTSGRDLEERVAGTVTKQYVWGLGYVNTLVLRDDNTGSGNSYGLASGGLHTRLFVQQDENFNVTSLTNPTGTVQERYQFDPYGTVTVLNANFTVKGSGLPSASGFAWQYLFQAGRLDTTSLLYHFGEPGRDYSTTLGRWLQPDGGYVDGMNLYQADDSGPTDHVDPTGMASDYLDWITPVLGAAPAGPDHGDLRGAAQPGVILGPVVSFLLNFGHHGSPPAPPPATAAPPAPPLHLPGVIVTVDCTGTFHLATIGAHGQVSPIIIAFDPNEGTIEFGSSDGGGTGVGPGTLYAGVSAGGTIYFGGSHVSDVGGETYGLHVNGPTYSGAILYSPSAGPGVSGGMGLSTPTGGIY